MMRLCLILFVVLLVSCRTTKVIEKDEVLDSTKIEKSYIERIVRDTISVQLPAERIEVVKFAPTDSDTISTTLATSVAYVDTLGLLHHKIWNKQKELPVIVEKKEVVRDSIVYKTKWKCRTVEKEKMPTWFEKFRQESWYFLVFVAIIALLCTKIVNNW